MGGSSSGLSSLDTRTTLGAAAPRRAAVRALRTGAGPLRRRSARFPRPRNRCVRLDHWVDTARPAPGKRNTGRSKYAWPTAGRHPGAFWTAPAPCRLDGARLRRILDRPTRKMLHPTVESALPPPWFGGAPGARFGGVFRARARSHRGRQPPIGVGKSPTPIHNFLPSSPGTRISPRQFAYPNAQFPTPMPGPGAGGARSPVWRSKMRLSSRLERGLVERMVQNASESARIRPDPAQIAKLRRILDRPRAVPPGWGETQTDFGPPHPAQEASPSCGSGAPTPWFGGAFRARNRSHRGRQPPIE